MTTIPTTNITASNSDSNHDSSNKTVEEELQLLGDPSGKQDAQYWDEWFQIVCCNNSTGSSNTNPQHSSFEWYCSSQEVLRVIQHHLSSSSSSSSGAVESNVDSNYNENSMIHPGSGTSVLPILLNTTYPRSRQLVMDISSVAIQTIQQFHETEAASNPTPPPMTKESELLEGIGIHRQEQSINRLPIEYMVCDLLLDDPDEIINHNNKQNSHSFAGWIDKGFIDAIFSKSNNIEDDKDNIDIHQKQKVQSERLFHLAHRTLQLNSKGFVVIISLGEDHSVQIIVENFWRQATQNKKSLWQPTFHVWELQPTSGNLPPFAFIFHTSSNNNNIKEQSENVIEEQFHVDTFSEVQIVFHWKDNVDNITESYTTYNTFIDRIHVLINDARDRFMNDKNCNINNYENHTTKKLSSTSKVLTIIEIKTYDDETNLIELGDRIRNTQWYANDGTHQTLLDIQWRTFDSIGEEEDIYCHIVPIGYGISKLQLQCIIERNDLDEFIILLEEFDTDIIQSVDIDWSTTIPIRQVDELVHLYTSKSS